ncbi:zinc-binding dehydrogenase [Herbidospora sp. NBRC 101105]|uniref:zinc-binding dehydrogenase n=1 Tax=Herbidospora sp. NBRC 101105 TaxID=3032195 RepID=UPI0033356E2F
MELGYGTTGLTDWARRVPGRVHRGGGRNLAPLPADVDHIVVAALPISGLTAWQGLFDHARLAAGHTVLVHGAAGAVGSIAVQLAREAGAYVIGTGRASDRDVVLGLGARAFVDTGDLGQVGEVDVVFDVIGGQVLERSAELVRPGGTQVTVAQPLDGQAVFFVVEPNRAQLAELAERVRTGRLTLRRPPRSPQPGGPPARRSSRWSRLSRSSAQPPGRRGAWDRWAPTRAAPG